VPTGLLYVDEKSPEMHEMNATTDVPLSFLDDIRQPYTWPDRNANRAALVAVKGSHFVSDGVLLGMTAQARKYRNENESSTFSRWSVSGSIASSGLTKSPAE